jgi:hypothetical protein
LNTSSCNSAAQWFKQLYNHAAGHEVLDAGRSGLARVLFNGTIYTRGAMTLEGLA